MVKFRSFHNIDLINASLIRKEIPGDFNEFIKEYVDFALHNENTKKYNIYNENTTVVRCIFDIVRIAVNNKPNEEQIEEMNRYAESIAEKLFREEQDVQQEIEHMGKNVKKGSLFQAFIKDDNGNYSYIIAKVEHSEWYDSDDLTKNIGFPSEKKNVWKSVVFPLIIDEEVSFDTIRVYTDNPAKYWATRFLELTEERNDYSNTTKAYRTMDISLKRVVKAKSEKDYYILRNSLIQRLKKPNLVNYHELVGELLDGYNPVEPSLDLNKVRQSLIELPDKFDFDKQFNSVPDAIATKRRINFAVTPDIDISISDSSTDYYDHIRAKERDNGERYLEIDCQDENTFKLFKECIHNPNETRSVTLV